MGVSLILLSLVVPPAPKIYTLSLHDALPICGVHTFLGVPLHDGVFRQLQYTRSAVPRLEDVFEAGEKRHQDRKSTRLNSSHLGSSYAVFCLKKKKSGLQSM